MERQEGERIPISYGRKESLANFAEVDQSDSTREQIRLIEALGQRSREIAELMQAASELSIEPRRIYYTSS